MKELPRWKPSSKRVLNSTHNDDVDTDYSHLSPGTTVSGLVCPECNGGSTNERSFNVSCVEDGNGSTLKWMCHRASCGYHGASSNSLKSLREGGQAGAKPSVAEVQAASLEERVGELIEIPTITKEYLINERYLTEPTLTKCGLRWATKHRRLYIPLRDENLSVVGCVLRTFDKSRSPKALTYYERDTDSSLGWFPAGRDGRLFIVEDVFSAIRLQQANVSSISLCGTNLSDARLQEIARASKDRYIPILALDLDAVGKAVGLIRNARRYLPGIQVVKITKDFKDLTPEEMTEYFQ